MKKLEEMPPLEVPLEAGRSSLTIALTPARVKRLLRLAEVLRTQRPPTKECPRPVPKLAALLDGIATGRVGLVRLDDPDGRVAAIVDGVPAVISRFDRAVEEPRRKRVLWWQREGN